MAKFEEISDKKYKSMKCDDWKIRSIIETKSGERFISSNSAWLERENSDYYSKENSTYVLRPSEHKYSMHNWVKVTFEPKEIAHVRDLSAVPDIVINDATERDASKSAKERLIKRFCKDVSDIDPRLMASLVFLQGECQKIVISYYGTDFANVAWIDGITSYIDAQKARQNMSGRYFDEVDHMITGFTNRLAELCEIEANND